MIGKSALVNDSGYCIEMLLIGVPPTRAAGANVVLYQVRMVARSFACKLKAAQPLGYDKHPRL